MGWRHGDRDDLMEDQLIFYLFLMGKLYTSLVVIFVQL